MDKKSLELYLVTDRYDYSLERFLKIIEEACQNGVTIVQLREKDITTKEYYDLALAVKKITTKYHIPLIIDDRLDVCLAADADGLHIGDDELPVSIVRKLLGPDKILGVSAKSVARAMEAEEEGADYLGVGAMYPTKTKVVTKLTSFDTLTAITDQVHIPTVVIGGINAERIKYFKNTGIAGVCMVSEIMKAENVSAKVEQLKVETIENIREE